MEGETLMTDRTLLRVLGGTANRRPFNVRVVRFGERYGRNDCLTHTSLTTLTKGLSS